jgi:hypothetical protein
MCNTSIPPQLPQTKQAVIPASNLTVAITAATYNDADDKFIEPNNNSRWLLQAVVRNSTGCYTLLWCHKLHAAAAMLLKTVLTRISAC